MKSSWRGLSLVCRSQEAAGRTRQCTGFPASSTSARTRRSGVSTTSATAFGRRRSVGTKIVRQNRRFCTNAPSENARRTVAPVKPVEPTFDQLKLVALTQAIPFVGFGIMDNAILIIAGDAIDTSLGVTLGISTMCAAAIGNIISDVAGIMLGTVIEDFCATVLRMPKPHLTEAQRHLRSVRWTNQLGCGVGIVVGCIIGMFPLLFLDPQKTERKKRDAHLEKLFRDVMTEANTLVAAESTCLYLRVQPTEAVEAVSSAHPTSNDGTVLSDIVVPNDQPPTVSSTTGSVSSWYVSIFGKNRTDMDRRSLHPTAEGTHLYAMYYILPHRKSDSTIGSMVRMMEGTSMQVPASSSTSRMIPLGRGIVSRAALTGQAWNIYDVHVEPDFLLDPAVYMLQDDHKENKGDTTAVLPSEVKNMVVVPVLDSQGRSIAVIQAMNKVSLDESGNSDGFSNYDVQVLTALASHISVSLQSIYMPQQDEEEARLKDAIRILKEHGLAKTQSSKTDLAIPKSANLFPER